MRLFKAILILTIIASTLCVKSYGQKRSVVVRAGRTTNMPVTDTTLKNAIIKDSVARDSITKDSIENVSTVKDSTVVGGVAFLKPKLIADSLTRKTTPENISAESKKLLDERFKRRFSLTGDTISAGALLSLSLVPGMGQIYNRQYWKVPVFYVGIGAFLTAGIITSNKFNDFKGQWQQAVNLNMPTEVTDPLKRKMQNAGTTRTVMYSLAAITYLYQVADATFNYRGYSNPVRKATTLAAVFPGAGFIYTKTYWRIPVYYGGFIALATVVDYNNRNYQRYKTAYNAITDGDPTTTDEFRGRYSAEALKSARDGYRRDRDFGIICLSAAYLLSVIDTYVIATLKNWDVGRDLSMKIEPAFFNGTPSDYVSALPSGAGLALKIKF